MYRRWNFWFISWPVVELHCAVYYISQYHGPIQQYNTSGRADGRTEGTMQERLVGCPSSLLLLPPSSLSTVVRHHRVIRRHWVESESAAAREKGGKPIANDDCMVKRSSTRGRKRDGGGSGVRRRKDRRLREREKKTLCTSGHQSGNEIIRLQMRDASAAAPCVYAIVGWR